MIPRSSQQMRMSRSKVVFLVLPCLLLLVVFYILGVTQGVTPDPATETALGSITVDASAGASASPETTPVATDTGFGFDTFLDVFMKLAIVVGLIYLVARGLRYMNGRSKAGDSQSLITVMETRSLAQNQALYLVQVGEKALLIGATGTQLSTLTEIDDPNTLSAMRTQAQTQVKPSETFARCLQSFGAIMPTSHATPQNEVSVSSRLHDATALLRRFSGEARQTWRASNGALAQPSATSEDTRAAVQ